MNPFLSLLAISLIPICVSVILFYVLKSKRFENVSYLKKQIIVGIVFGIVAIIATEGGVPYNGAIINVRDAAPLCAALIFGPEAGIISGIIGGIERWFSVLWGGGYYTRVACTISTILTGIIGAFLKKNLHNDRMVNWTQALVIGVVCEVIHMLMIFITNMNDIKRAFDYVEMCTLPMVIVNAFAVTFAVYFLQALEKPNIHKDDYRLHSISTQFQTLLLWVVIGSFAVTSAFGYLVQNQISTTETNDLLRLNIDDVVNDLKAQFHEALLTTNRVIANEVTTRSDIDLVEMKQRFNIAEINLVGKDGIIYASSEPDYIGFDMASGSQSAEFLCLLEGEKEYVQAFRPITINNDVYRKYSGVAIENGFVQIAYGEEQFSENMESRLTNIAHYRHIGETGNILVVDSEGNLVSSSIDDDVNTDVDIKINPKDTEEDTVYRAIINGQNYYYMFKNVEGYSIYAILPSKEADFAKNMSTYLTQFLQTIVFGALFVVIYFITKALIVNNIRSINTSLNKITDGNLDTVVDVRTSREFVSLSDGINTTVDSLKHFIAEANARIDNELKYAKEIQSSALPSNFPAYPNRDEFDIYALMDPAKEVGGDFYDFYLLKGHILVFLVADVAGKGIPASLFMMRAKTILKTYAENNISVADIFTNANYQLCEGNDAGMFVTAWMGFLDLETGELKYANAGHNRPLIRRKDGLFEYLQGPAGFVLAGMEGIVYKEQTMMLEPGDEIFLYTDGVVEATNLDKQLYGDDRLQICINKIIGSDSMTICNAVKEDVDKFYEGAEQFDDITELSMQFKKYCVKK